MKVNSTTFLCTLPHFRLPPAEEDNSTSLSHAEEEKERNRARKKGWELLRPLEGNCMYLVTSPTSPQVNYRTRDGGHMHSVIIDT